MNREKMLLEEYCPEQVEQFLHNCVKAHLTCMIGGLVGTGKTELIKYMTGFIPAYERVWTIEDTLEIRYQAINPGKDCVEVKVSQLFGYAEALKASKRQLPTWVLVAEVRGAEVKYLMENVSAGVHCISTIHVDDIRRLPDRLQNMGASVQTGDIFSFIDIGILVESEITDMGIKRQISQIMCFSRYEEENKKLMLYEDGKFYKGPLPPDIQRKFDKAGVQDIWTWAGEAV